MASPIAIVEDSTKGRLLLGSLLRAGHYEIACMPSDTAMETLADEEFSLLLVGPNVQQPGRLVGDLKRKSAFRHAPVLALVQETTPAKRIGMITSGIRDVADYPVSEPYLLARIRALLREAEAFREVERRRLASLKFGFAEAPAVFATRRRITLLQGRDTRCEPIECGRSGGWCVTAQTTASALSPGDDRDTPDGYVLDWRSTNAQSPLRQALPELRARAHSRHSVILVVHEVGDNDAAVQALDAGASDVISAAVSSEEISYRISRLLKRKIAEDALRKSSEDSLQMAVTDSLTGLYNRRYAEAYMADLLDDRAKDQSFALMIADIDHFKAINDTHGHAAGDEVLRDVAARLRAEMRAPDLVARYGGEEFLVVLAESDLASAKQAANRLRRRIGNTPVVLANGDTLDVTLSIGVSLGTPSVARCARTVGALAAPFRHGQMSDLLHGADRALYRAKADGRNRIRMAVNPA